MLSKDKTNEFHQCQKKEIKNKMCFMSNSLPLNNVCM